MSWKLIDTCVAKDPIEVRDSETGELMATVPINMKKLPESVRRAKLIAVAPEMLEMLRRFPDNSPYHIAVELLISTIEGKV